jgi:hypothetical protein
MFPYPETLGKEKDQVSLHDCVEVQIHRIRDILTEIQYVHLQPCTSLLNTIWGWYRLDPKSTLEPVGETSDYGWNIPAVIFQARLFTPYEVLPRLETLVSIQM